MEQEKKSKFKDGKKFTLNVHDEGENNKKNEESPPTKKKGKSLILGFDYFL